MTLELLLDAGIAMAVTDEQPRAVRVAGHAHGLPQLGGWCTQSWRDPIPPITTRSVGGRLAVPFFGGSASQ